MKTAQQFFEIIQQILSSTPTLLFYPFIIGLKLSRKYNLDVIFVCCSVFVNIIFLPVLIPTSLTISLCLMLFLIPSMFVSNFNYFLNYLNPHIQVPFSKKYGPFENKYIHRNHHKYPTISYSSCRESDSISNSISNSISDSMSDSMSDSITNSISDSVHSKSQNYDNSKMVPSTEEKYKHHEHEHINKKYHNSHRKNYHKNHNSHNHKHGHKSHRHNDYYDYNKNNKHNKMTIHESDNILDKNQQNYGKTDDIQSNEYRQTHSGDTKSYMHYHDANISEISEYYSTDEQ
jgi:hypothetical protein